MRCKVCGKDLTGVDFHKCCNILFRANEKGKDLGGFYIKGVDMTDKDFIYDHNKDEVIIVKKCKKRKIK